MILAISQSYNLSEAKAVLGDLKSAAEHFARRHEGAVEGYLVREIEYNTKQAFRQIKNAIRTDYEAKDTRRDKRNIFGLILHSLADVATG